MDSEKIEEEEKLHLDKHDDSISSSTSSSSGDDDDDDFFQIEPDQLTASPIGNLKLPAASPAKAICDPLISIDIGSAVATNPFLSSSPSSDPFASLTPTMASPDSVVPPDTNRIPSSVFARTKSTTPMEWSVASNESLFSIHMGNNSFSRDHAIFLERSGELTSLSGGGGVAAGGMMNLYPTSPVSPAIPISSEPTRVDAEAANAEAMKDLMMATVEGQARREKFKASNEDGNGGLAKDHLANISRNSDGSGTSFSSFAFPILIGEGGRNMSVKVRGDMVKKSSPTYEAPHPQTVEVPAAATSSASASPPAAESSCFSCFASCFSCCHQHQPTN